MKTKYIKPITEVISFFGQTYLMMSNSESEVTENIGAKENSDIWDWDTEFSTNIFDDELDDELDN